jgi:hypothetical protein
MKTNCLSRTKSWNKGNKIFNLFNGISVTKISEISGYRLRKSGKITARRLILGFMTMVSKKMNTYEAWAQEISLQAGCTVSKQAVEDRMNYETATMVRMVLEDEIRKKLLAREPKKNRTRSKFSSIKMEDSTVINLPPELAFAFPGNVSLGRKKSQIKIHAFYNQSDNIFHFLNLHSFTTNDQSLARVSLDHVQPGDLILRDMGFLVLDVLTEIDKYGGFFISRKNATIKVLDVSSEKEIDLVRLLRKGRFLDQEVLIGKDKKVKMRMIAIPLPKDQASARRRKARRDRDKRLNHDKAYYELLGYLIFITNVPKTKCTAEEIKDLYGLRWQIEIIFKSWKSHFNMGKLIPLKCINPYRVQCMIYLWLLYIFLFQVIWLAHFASFAKTDQHFSLLKMSRMFNTHFEKIITGKSEGILYQLIISKCSFDKRNDRINMSQKFDKIAA